MLWGSRLCFIYLCDRFPLGCIWWTFFWSVISGNTRWIQCLHSDCGLLSLEMIGASCFVLNCQQSRRWCRWEATRGVYRLHRHGIVIYSWAWKMLSSLKPKCCWWFCRWCWYIYAIIHERFGCLWGVHERMVTFRTLGLRFWVYSLCCKADAIF